MIPCLLNQDVVLVCCEADDESITARWVQFNPAVHPTILGTEQDLYYPKEPDTPPIRVRVPDEPLAEVHTDVRFPIIPVDS